MQRSMLFTFTADVYVTILVDYVPTEPSFPTYPLRITSHTMRSTISLLMNLALTAARITQLRKRLHYQRYLLAPKKANSKPSLFIIYNPIDRSTPLFT